MSGGGIVPGPGGGGGGASLPDDLAPFEPAGTPAPLLWWRLDETDVSDTTPANSGSAAGAGGTITGGLAGASGPWGDPCVQLAGAGSIQTPLDVVRPTAAITVALWFRQVSLAATRLAVRTYAAAWGAPFTSVSLYVDGSGVLSGAVNVGGAEQSARLAGMVARAAQWHHAAVTFDGASVRAYLDGVLLATTAAAGTIDYGADPTLTRWRIGGNPVAGGEYLTGEVADVRVYDVAQATAWVARAYKRGRRSYEGS